MSKGKEKLLDTSLSLVDPAPSTNMEESMVCGICYCEDGRAIRGYIDSCNHYFCFVCIMEWARIESRCPLCKQRFNNIRRPPKFGCFIRERIVHVPVRNQVWHPLGNMSSRASDPYEQVNCTECRSVGDENLLLLCDLCDSASHTYCVGLGKTVPEGDWYCFDCNLSRNDHNDSQIDTACYDEDSGNLESAEQVETSVSIFEIVREPNNLETNRLSPRRNSSNENQISSPNIPDTGTNGRSDTTDLSARTLRRCRNVQTRIQILRENWNSFRTGSLKFSSSLYVSDTNQHTADHSQSIITEVSNKSQLLSTTTKEVVSCDNKQLRDISRAWKIMDKAISLKRPREVSGWKSSCEPDTTYVSKQASPQNSIVTVSKHKQIQSNNLGGNALVRSYRCAVSETGEEQYQCLNSKIRNSGSAALKKTSNIYEKPSSTQTSGHFVVPTDACQYIDNDLCHENDGNLSLRILMGASSRLMNEKSAIVNSVDHAHSSQVTSYPLYNRSEFRVSDGNHGSKAEQAKESVGMKTNCTKVLTKENDGGKAEIQYLVKLNLKLLTRSKQLGVSEFKEVARRSTHTILAACGLNQTKSGVGTFPNSICWHIAQSQQVPLSNLMHNTCKECFYMFVKEIVNSVLVKKVNCLQSNS